MNQTAAEAVARTAAPPPPILTLRRLMAIRPGERIRYYSGDRRDIDAAGSPPRYRDILARVFDAAADLESNGRARLVEEKRTIMGPPVSITVTDFIAIGRQERAS